MTAAELKAHKNRLGLTWPELAKRVGYSTPSIKRMAAGRQGIREAVALALEAMK